MGARTLLLKSNGQGGELAASMLNTPLCEAGRQLSSSPWQKAEQAGALFFLVVRAHRLSRRSWLGHFAPSMFMDFSHFLGKAILLASSLDRLFGLLNTEVSLRVSFL